jgi:Protein of unknown function (DUF3105)
MTAKPRRPQPSNRSRRRRPSAAERAAAAARRRRLRIIAWVTAAVLLVGGAIGFAVVRSQANTRAVRALGVQTFASQGQEHLQPGQDYTAYNSTPPTSGPHSPSPAPCGISSQPIPNTVQVHDLEHGVVMVQYRPGLDPAQVSALEALGRSYSSHVIVAPYPNLPTPVAATAWTKLLRLDRADVGKLRRFIDLFRQKGPEAGVACPGSG